jgi:ABC-type dipeptide/oligopeptide/nickel transport system permease subunit
MADVAHTAAVDDSSSDTGLRPFLRKLLAKYPARISLAILVLAIVCALFPQWIAPHDPFAQDLTRRLLPPAWADRGTWSHLLGTDQLGRDVLSRIIEGAQLTLFVSLFAVIVSCIVGVAAGLVAGYNGGMTDAVILRLIDMQLAFPLILLVIAVVAVVGPSLGNLIIIMGLSGWPRFARIVRGSVLSVRGLEFVEAARSIGASRLRIMLRHILPNVVTAAIVFAMADMVLNILVTSSLSFLGLGVQPPNPEWGLMVAEARDFFLRDWRMMTYPGLAVLIVGAGFGLIGDGLAQALRPKG